MLDLAISHAAMVQVLLMLVRRCSMWLLQGWVV
jgi:hypothetical protein